MRLTPVFGPPFSGELDRGQISKCTMGPIVVVVVAVFFEHESGFPISNQTLHGSIVHL
jgi:hypothetical protein